MHAHLNEWRRPWDGIDGADFKAWKVGCWLTFACLVDGCITRVLLLLCDKQGGLEEVTDAKGNTTLVTPYMRAMEEMEDDDDLPLTTMERRVAAVKKGFGAAFGQVKEAMGF